MTKLNLTLTSTAFNTNTPMPEIYTCNGKNINPPFIISGISENTKSLAFTLEDPDSPRGTWDHWLVWNISPETIEIKEGKEPEGIKGKGTAGNLGYYGPCPNAGTHRYFFRVYALDTMLDLAEGSSKAELFQAMESHIIDRADIIGLYSKI